jgi:hypothetical protein
MRPALVMGSERGRVLTRAAAQPEVAPAATLRVAQCLLHACRTQRTQRTLHTVSVMLHSPWLTGSTATADPQRNEYEAEKSSAQYELDAAGCTLGQPASQPAEWSQLFLRVRFRARFDDALHLRAYSLCAGLAHARTYAHRDGRTDTDARARAHTHVHPCTHVERTRTLTLAHCHVYTHARTHAYARARACTCARARTHARTQARKTTHDLSRSLRLRLTLAHIPAPHTRMHAITEPARKTCEPSGTP